MSAETYAKYNRRVMLIMFFIPLLVIAFWETTLDMNANRFMKVWFSATDEGEEDDPAIQNPEVDEPDGRKICTVPFEDLVKEFPDAAAVCLTFPSKSRLVTDFSIAERGNKYLARDSCAAFSAGSPDAKADVGRKGMKSRSRRAPPF